MRKTVKSILALLFVSLTAMADDFALGADISWETEMEAKDEKLFNYQGEERECTALMKEMGLNAIRLRVWVNPSEGTTADGKPFGSKYCNKEDVLIKAKRAKELGMNVMIDFHYSDWWADPGKQTIPKAWEKHKYKQMLTDVAEHTKEVLTFLKDNGVTPKWVQVGNETSNGMLWPVGNLEQNPKQYAGLFKAGYDAVKEIIPEAIVIVHLDNGYDNDLYNRNLDALRDNGAKWDMIGMSLYPYWSRKTDPNVARLMMSFVKNVKSVAKKYGTDVMLVETGFEVNEKEPWIMSEGRTQLTTLIDLCRNSTDGHCKGVFYWEPECKPSLYKLGAFTMSGHPTEIMRAFTHAAYPDKSAMAKFYDRKMVKLATSEGDIIVELYNETPGHRDNFLKIVRGKSLDGTLIHRAMNNFIIQGGDPESKNCDATTTEFPADPLGRHSVLDEKGEEYTLPAEILYPRFFNKRGALGAARQDEEKNPEYRSSSSQFYIVWGKWPTAKKAGSDQEPLGYYQQAQQAGVPYLDGTYTVYGEVVSGLEVVDKIQKKRVDANDRPVDDVVIKTFSVLGE